MKNDIIFHEVYGVYYQAIGQIVNEILSSNNQSIGKDRFTEIISDFAFQESSAKSEGSKLLAKTVDEHRYRGIVDKVELEKGGYVYRTSLKHRVKTPLTTLEKRWLKTISSDPRIKLFDCEFPDLSGVEPLYHDDDIYYCGQYTLGDDYESEKYVSIFKTVAKKDI